MLVFLNGTCERRPCNFSHPRINAKQKKDMLDAIVKAKGKGKSSKKDAALAPGRGLRRKIPRDPIVLTHRRTPRTLRDPGGRSRPGHGLEGAEKAPKPWRQCRPRRRRPRRGNGSLGLRLRRLLRATCGIATPTSLRRDVPARLQGSALYGTSRRR